MEDGTSGRIGFARKWCLFNWVLFNLLSERMSAQQLLCGSIITQAVGMLLLIWAPSLGWLIMYVLLYGAAYGAISPLRAAVMAEHMGRRAYGSILAWQGLTQKDLGEQLGLSFSGAKSHVQRAREKLKQELLACCHFKLDRRGHIINYQPRSACCEEGDAEAPRYETD